MSNPKEEDSSVKNLIMHERYDGSEIAVIGMACRFPGAKGPDAFWENLQNGTESITFFSNEELISTGVSPEALEDSQYVKARPVLENVEMFDAAFFGFNPREASILDPQHRLFLECTWEAIENAGYDTERYNGLISLFAGASMSTYLANNLYANPEAMVLGGEFQSYLYNTQDSLATGVAYKLNLKGACYTVQTFCSTSLVALHLACQSLLNFECDMAATGGVSVTVPQASGYWFHEGMIVSPDGHCRPFDADAKGTIFGNGLGVVVLKRIEDALADGDHIEAVIRGSATNNDGALKVSYTAPSVSGQAAVIAEALAAAGVEPHTVSYIETHGTGTALGDPTEIAALTKAFRAGTDQNGFCALGSVKSNFGHLDAAAGVASLIKAILSLKHRKIPPSLHFKRPNPEIDFKNSPFYVNYELMEWKRKETPLRAGVSSFGVGGTNAHVVLEEPPPLDPSGAYRSHQLLVISTKTAAALDKATQRLAQFFLKNPEINLADTAFTLQTGRRTFNYRRAIVCQDVNDASAIIKGSKPLQLQTAYQDRRNPPVVFMFSGQGSQYVNMGKELYETEAVFREHIDHCTEILRAHMSLDLRDILYPREGTSDELARRLRQTDIAQPALFTIEYALARLWMSWGVQPGAMVGHSIGEYVAACLAGVFSLEEALFLVAARGRLMQKLSGGSMLAVSLPEAELDNYLASDLSIAAVNAPSFCVLSGESEAAAAIEERLKDAEIGFTRLHTSHAFHSAMMDPVLPEFREQAKQVHLHSPQIRILSNLTGKWLSAEDATDPEYWVRHLRHTVRFSDSIGLLLKETGWILLEVGPGNVLSTLARQQKGQMKNQAILSSIRHPKEERSDIEFILNTLGELWLNGIDVNWDGLHQNEKRYRVALPTYPFERRRYWIEPAKAPQGYPALQAALTKTSKNYQASSPPEIQIEELVPRDEGLQSDYVAPRDEIEKAMTGIWQKLLGVKQIGVQDDYFDLGGTSMLVTRLFAQIESRFNKKLPLTTMINAPTIEQLSRIVADENWSASWSPLVALEEAGSNPPFFCIHGADGLVFIYRDLARHLGADQPFYGLQSQGLDGEKPFHTCIEDMASLYIKEIQTVQPEGPYHLGGYCMGGTIAFEMAQQLLAQGHEIGLLAMLETYNWANFKQPSFFSKAHYYMQKIDFHVRNLFIAESTWTFLQEKLKVAKNRSEMWTGALQAKFFDKFSQGNGIKDTLSQLWDNNDRAAANYRPRIYPGCITGFRPIKQYAWYDGPELGWEELAVGGVEVHILPVYPAGMLMEPFVKQLATELKTRICNSIEKVKGPPN
jgi:acyl transferase domain-containing protein/thioesterase domain-containing protein